MLMAEIKVRDRLTVVERIYHQNPEEHPTSYESRFSRELQTKEQPYVRRATVKDLRELDTGWIEPEQVGCLFIRNEEGVVRQTILSEGEKAELDRKVIYLGEDPENLRWMILPGESFRATPTTAKGLLICCPNGPAKCSLHVFPK